MRSAFGSLAGALIISMAGLAMAGTAEGQETVPYWHVWVDNDGVSHQKRCVLRSFEKTTFDPPAPPLWLDRIDAPGASVAFAIQPVGWQGTWHRNPKPQWIIPLSGRWYVETMDGVRVEMGPGDISFGEDQLAEEGPDGKVGHLSGTVGDEPAVLMVVQLDVTPTKGEPCRFK